MDKSNRPDNSTQPAQGANDDWPIWRKGVAGALAGNALALFMVLLLRGSYLWFIVVPVSILIFIALPSRVYKQ